jgi:hypothetical protein
MISSHNVSEESLIEKNVSCPSHLKLRGFEGIHTGIN